MFCLSVDELGGCREHVKTTSLAGWLVGFAKHDTHFRFKMIQNPKNRKVIHAYSNGLFCCAIFLGMTIKHSPCEAPGSMLIQKIWPPVSIAKKEDL